MTEDKPAKREKIGFLAPAFFVGLMAATLVGTYYVRKELLERTMASAVETGDEGTMAAMVDAFPCPARVRGKDGRTPLHWMARAGRAGLVKRLLSRGADVNAKDGMCLTPLMEAASEGHAETVEALLAAGAETHAKTPLGWTPLFMAEWSGDNKTIKRLSSGAAWHDPERLLPDPNRIVLADNDLAGMHVRKTFRARWVYRPDSFDAGTVQDVTLKGFAIRLRYAFSEGTGDAFQAFQHAVTNGCPTRKIPGPRESVLSAGSWNYDGVTPTTLRLATYAERLVVTADLPRAPTGSRQGTGAAEEVMKVLIAKYMAARRETVRRSWYCDAVLRDGDTDGLAVGFIDGAILWPQRYSRNIPNLLQSFQTGGVKGTIEYVRFQDEAQAVEMMKGMTGDREPRPLRGLWEGMRGVLIGNQCWHYPGAEAGKRTEIILLKGPLCLGIRATTGEDDARHEAVLKIAGTVLSKWEKASRKPAKE